MTEPIDLAALARAALEDDHEGGYGVRASTREPLLAQGCLDAADEIERLRIVRKDECTCPHGDAREPASNHAKDCPIRVNRLKRVPPAVALDRLARALDSGKENDALLTLLLEACDLADEANGDPSACPYNVPVGERVAEIRAIAIARGGVG